MNEIVVTKSQPIVSYNQEQIEVIKTQIAKGATDTELALFINQCKRTGLDPFARHIYFIKNPRDGKVQIQVSIDGFRAIAQRSGEYEGQTPTQWCGPDAVWKEVWLQEVPPVAARVGVYKKGFREPPYAVAHWNEYYAQPGYMQKKMPAAMLGKVAESLALRRAFPNEMGGLYTQEEMAQESYQEPKVLKSSFSAPPEANATTTRASEMELSGTEEFVIPGSPVPDETIIESDPGEYVITIGKKFKGKKLSEVSLDDLAGFSSWLQNQAMENNKPLYGESAAFVENVDAYIKKVKAR